MKKLIIACAAVAMAAGMQAAEVNWSLALASQKYVWDSNSGNKLASGTVYFFDSSVAQQAVLTAAIDHGSDWLSYVGADYVGQSTISSQTPGTIPGAAWSGTVGAATDEPAPDYIAGTKYQFYGVIYDDANDRIYFSSLTAGKNAAQGSVAVSWNPDTTSQKALGEFTRTYGSTGWYATVDVPEPTSGMLLLLGMGALALRRRRA